MAGLSSIEADKRLQKFGANIIKSKKGDGPITIFLKQFNSPFIYILLLAAVVSYFLDHHINSYFIFAVLLLNASIGTIQEYSAQRTADALRLMVPQYAHVLRDGKTQKIDVANIVPGDRIVLASGDKIAADARLISASELKVDESVLTGESQSVNKRSFSTDAKAQINSSSVFAGTVVTHGRAEGDVVATGQDTEIGHIAKAVSSDAMIKPPLLQRLERFTLTITYSISVVILVLIIISLSRGADLATVFLLAIGLAVSAIPEGLPAAITVALAIGMRRMSRAKVIIRKLLAVESLGSCTFIASDKTGTLTVNEMTVKKIAIPEEPEAIEVSGVGINQEGCIQYNEQKQGLKDKLELLIEAGMYANEADFVITPNGDNSAGSYHYEATGDGVDLALLALAAKYGYDQDSLRHDNDVIAEIPYESENAFSARIVKKRDNSLVFVKGSFEKILSMCSTINDGSPLDHHVLQKQMLALASNGYRVLALASKPCNTSTKNPWDTLHNLQFLGMVGMVDPIRPEAKKAIIDCKKARIDVAMITGDHPHTASAIGRELGIADKHVKAVTGDDIRTAESSGADALAKLVSSTRIFARIEPVQKLLIVEELIKQGHFVAVTGDGVNDAPALKHAHVGVAMGLRGTDLARESSDIIITDDNFSSLVKGIIEGRIVYNNIRKVVFLLISTGTAEILLFILSTLFGLPLPLFPVQLLWLNLVTNGVQDVALAFEPAEGNELGQRPRKPGEAIFNRLMLERVIINALVMGSIAFAVFAWCLANGMDDQSARNITLLLMVFFENVHVLNSRSEKQSIFKQYFWGNPLLLAGMITAQSIHILAMHIPFMSRILEVEPVSFLQWLSLLAIALILIVVDELHKKWKGRNPNEASTSKYLLF